MTDNKKWGLWNCSKQSILCAKIYSSSSCRASSILCLNVLEIVRVGDDIAVPVSPVCRPMQVRLAADVWRRVFAVRSSVFGRSNWNAVTLLSCSWGQELGMLLEFPHLLQRSHRIHEPGHGHPLSKRITKHSLHPVKLQQRFPDFLFALVTAHGHHQRESTRRHHNAAGGVKRLRISHCRLVTYVRVDRGMPSVTYEVSGLGGTVK